MMEVTATILEFDEAAARISDLGREYHRRGWALGTSGNFSAVLNRQPLELAITSSGVDKGALNPDRILRINGEGKVLQGDGRPSDETMLHLAIVRQRGVGAVLHTHSVWSTVISQMAYARGGIKIEGYEMLKGLSGVRTHEHREWIPILDNSQDMRTLAAHLELTLQRNPAVHGVLFKGHGLYTWGASLSEAARHIEIFEFLLEVFGRTKLPSINGA